MKPAINARKTLNAEVWPPTTCLLSSGCRADCRRDPVNPAAGAHFGGAVAGGAAAGNVAISSCRWWASNKAELPDGPVAQVQTLKCWKLSHTFAHMHAGMLQHDTFRLRDQRLSM